jgi:membrane protein DedA with SNARE-associated domain
MIMDNIWAFIQNIFLLLKTGQFPQLGIWTYFILGSLVAVEGPIATLIGAAAASAGFLRPVWVFIAAATGNLTADTIWYTMGRLGKIEPLFRLGQRFGIQKALLERLEKGMHEHATRILFIAKLTVSFIIPSLIAAGLVKAPWRRWFPAIFLGEMIWSGSLVLIGFYATEMIKRVEKGMEYAAIGGGLLFIFFLFFIGKRLLRKHYQDADLQNS